MGHFSRDSFLPPIGDFSTFSGVTYSECLKKILGASGLNLSSASVFLEEVCECFCRLELVVFLVCPWKIF